MDAITDHRTLIDALGGQSELSKLLGDLPDPQAKASPVRIGQWKINNRIPPEFWLHLVAIAADRNIRAESGEPVTTDWLTRTLRPRGSNAATEKVA